jgi:hypothetical protein
MTAKNQEINWAADDLNDTNNSSDKRKKSVLMII